MTRRNRRRPAKYAAMETMLMDLPEELLLQELLPRLDTKELLQARKSCRRMHELGACNSLWRKLFEERWGPEVSAVQEEAASLAGSFLQLYQSKHTTDASGNGWTRPCEHELRAVLLQLARRAAATTAASAAPVPATPPGCAPACCMDLAPPSPASVMAASPMLSPAPSAMSLSLGSAGSMMAAGIARQRAAAVKATEACAVAEEAPGDVAPEVPEVHLVYLLDGSGSVSEEDFNEMRRFVVVSAPILAEALGAAAAAKVGVLQFSTEPRVEVPLAPLGPDMDTLRTALDTIVRINGGTNIATAIAKAGAMMKAEDQARAAVAAASAQAELSPADNPPGSPCNSTGSGSMMMAMSPAGSPRASAAGTAPLLMPGSPHAGPPGVAGGMAMPIAAAAWRAAALPCPPRVPSSAASDTPIPMDAEAPPCGSGAAPGSPGRSHGPAVSRPIRMVLLLTDGRVDTYQAREARTTACRLHDELWGCTLAAFGVGRGVDRTELLHIIDTPQGDAAVRYLDLYTRDDSPW